MKPNAIQSARPVSLRRRQKQKGNAFLEFAAAFPLIILLVIGSIDIARSLSHAVSVAEGAYAGTSYATLTNVHSSDLDTAEGVATSSADPDTGGTTATAERYCDCPNNPASGPTDAAAVNCITGSCGTYGNPRVYIKTTVETQFDSFFVWGANGDIDISRAVYRRVQ